MLDVPIYIIQILRNRRQFAIRGSVAACLNIVFKQFLNFFANISETSSISKSFKHMHIDV